MRQRQRHAQHVRPSAAACLSRDQVQAVIAEIGTFVAACDERFEELHGRQPTPDDPVIVTVAGEDVDLLPSQAASLVARSLAVAGVAPQVIHAFRRTGMLVTEDNLDLWSAEEVRRWMAAVEESQPAAAG
jgi:hypothetical protein